MQQYAISFLSMLLRALAESKFEPEFPERNSIKIFLGSCRRSCPLNFKIVHFGIPSNMSPTPLLFWLAWSVHKCIFFSVMLLDTQPPILEQHRQFFLRMKCSYQRRGGGAASRNPHTAYSTQNDFVLLQYTGYLHYNMVRKRSSGQWNKHFFFSGHWKAHKN